jgi:hypothetical protein
MGTFQRHPNSICCGFSALDRKNMNGDAWPDGDVARQDAESSENMGQRATARNQLNESAGTQTVHHGQGSSVYLVEVP